LLDIHLVYPDAYEMASSLMVEGVHPMTALALWMTELSFDGWCMSTGFILGCLFGFIVSIVSSLPWFDGKDSK